MKTARYHIFLLPIIFTIGFVVVVVLLTFLSYRNFIPVLLADVAILLSYFLGIRYLSRIYFYANRLYGSYYLRVLKLEVVVM